MITSDAISWDAPDGDHPARRASQRSYAGHDAIRKFWAAAIEPIATFHFHITDSHAGGNECANIGTITTTFHDGGQVDTELVMVYRVNADGLVASMRAHWEPERAMATYRKPSV